MPHTMKRYLIILSVLALCACVWVSCDTEAQSTPEIVSPNTLIRTSAEGVRDTITYADTLHIGDTVRAQLFLYGHLNYLTRFQATSDASIQMYLAKMPEDSIYLLPESDYSKCLYVFTPEKVSLCVTTLVYTPTQAGKYRIEMVLASSAKEAYSPRTFYFDTNVK